MSTHAHGPAPRSPVARGRAPHPRPGRRPAPDSEEVWLALRRLALLAAVALLVSQLAGAFAGIVVVVAGLAVLAAHAAAHPHES